MDSEIVTAELEDRISRILNLLAEAHDCITDLVEDHDWDNIPEAYKGLKERINKALHDW